MRLSTACVQCRLSKCRCIRDERSRSCQPCNRRDTICSFDDSITLPQDNHRAGGLTKSALRSIVADYFYYIHDKPHSLFLSGAINEAIDTGKLPRAVLFGIAALGARFSSDEHIRSRVAEFASISREAFKVNLELVSLENIQTCILLGEYAAATSDRSAEIMYDTCAVRMAQVLGLSADDTTLAPVENELRRRIWYSCCMIDTWASTGLNIPSMIHSHTSMILTLTPEDQLQKLTSIHDTCTGGGIGLWTFMARLALIYARVRDLHCQLVAFDRDEHAIHESTTGIAADLDQYYTNLPASLQFDPENLQSHITRGIGHVFIALHLGFHHYSTLVYFPYLDPRRSGLRHTTVYAERCKYHAAALSDILSTSLALPGCETLYQTVGQMATVSSCVLIYILLLGETHEIDATKARLGTNFTKIIELMKYWPAVHQVKDKLLDFQSACLVSETETVHTLDNWMVKFLLHYALPLPEKRLDRFSGTFSKKVEVTGDIFQRFNVTKFAT